MGWENIGEQAWKNEWVKKNGKQAFPGTRKKTDDLASRRQTNAELLIISRGPAHSIALPFHKFHINGK